MSATNKLILSNEEVSTATLKAISATTKMILSTEEVVAYGNCVVAELTSVINTLL